MELTSSTIITAAVVVFLIVASGLFAYALLAVNSHERDDKQIYENEIENKALREPNKRDNDNLVDNREKIEPCPICRRNLGISITNHSNRKTIIHHTSGKRSPQC